MKSHSRNDVREDITSSHSAFFECDIFNFSPTHYKGFTKKKKPRTRLRLTGTTRHGDMFKGCGNCYSPSTWKIEP